jgi:cell wall-associated NlpC family hydrolase
MRGFAIVQPLKRGRHRVRGLKRRPRQTAAALLCALLAFAVWSAPASAHPAPKGEEAGSAFRVLGSTVLGALGSAGANDAIDTLGNSLALLEARYRLEHRAAVEEAKQKANPAGAPAKDELPPALSEEVVDPKTLPPASAGTNGSITPHAGHTDIVAHSRELGGESTSILLSGVALAPPDAPEAVKNVVNAANTIVGRPYIWGGGHASFYSTGYDCSGSVSFALFGGGLIPEPLTSGALEGWGAPGPGKWITVYASPTHTFAEIAGLRWDTVGDARGTGPRWHLAPASGAGFVVRHPPGY